MKYIYSYLQFINEDVQNEISGQTQVQQDSGSTSGSTSGETSLSGETHTPYVNPDLNKYVDMIEFACLKERKEDISEALQIALQNHFYGIAVLPDYIDFVKFSLEDDNQIKIISFLNYPEGKDKASENLSNCIKMVADGCDIINYCANYSEFIKSYESVDEEFRENFYKEIENDIRQIANECHKNGTILKTIIEVNLLTMEQLSKFCEIISNAGTDMVMTNTGYNGGLPDLNKIQELRRLLPDSIKICVSGGIRNITDLEKYFEYADFYTTSVIPK